LESKNLSAHLHSPPIHKSFLPGLGVFEREIRRFFKVPAQTILGPLGSSILYFAIFKFSIGKLASAAGSSGQSISNGVDYLLFLIPGIMTMESINASIQNPMSSIMISKWTGTIVDMLMAPLQPFAMWLAYISGAVVRASLVALMAYLAGSAFAFDFHMHNIFVLLFALVLTAGIFGSLGILAGTLCRDWDQIGLILSFVLQPLVFLSGVFFSFSGLPESLSWAPYVNPIFYLVLLWL
jgi:ABC-2 type transport system permease protein